MTLDEFKKEKCSLCGTQRCTSEGEWLEACPNYRKLVLGENNETQEKEKTMTYKDQIEIYLNSLKQEGYKNAIEDAANWIDNNILSYINLQDEYEDAPNTITLSKYCINAFKEDMLKKILV